MACNNVNQVRELFIPARAGSTLAFVWSPWQVSHKGPVLTYMAPYDRDPATANLQQLEFFKIQEKGLLKDNSTWATDELIRNNNVAWATIPHDIKPGKYVVRHEIIGLHFATEDSVWTRLGDKAVLGPQHFIQCINVDVSGTGSAAPQGASFPGGYKHFKQEPGLYFDVYWGVTPYPIPGPSLYRPSSPAPTVAESVARTSLGKADMQWFTYVMEEAKRPDPLVDEANEQRPKHGPLENATGPGGIVDPSQTVLGPGTFLGCKGENCTRPVPKHMCTRCIARN